jgi:hypothetical protein
MIPACYRGWMAGEEAQRPVRIGEELPPNGRACLSRASHQRCGPAASRIARPRCVRGSSRRKPAGRYPEVLPRMGLPAPSPGGAAALTRIHLSSHPDESGTPVRRTSLRRDPGPGARHTAAGTFGLRTFRTSCRRGPSPMDVSSIATAYTAFSEVLTITAGSSSGTAQLSQAAAAPYQHAGPTIRPSQAGPSWAAAATDGRLDAV